MCLRLIGDYTFFRAVSRYLPAAQQRLLTNLKLLNDLSTFLTIADVIQLRSSYTACFQFNKRQIKQPETFSKPLCERIFIHKKFTK